MKEDLKYECQRRLETILTANDIKWNYEYALELAKGDSACYKCPAYETRHCDNYSLLTDFKIYEVTKDTPSIKEVGIQYDLLYEGDYSWLDKE